ncbi:putative transporter [Cyphellophora attinorum]|uniref:Putative transporter n=1 Tax=Cyphellophora attinorum TaxID=1664694 RepID=A0A0N1H4L9_9EURO|nr:putative transporter [Phialophora attinorum]KPI40255.1 putative transporter [Phialophora attinorum]
MATHTGQALGEKRMASVGGAILEDQQHPAALTTTKADYVGAQTKSDPDEIRLVRKLDWFMMTTADVVPDKDLGMHGTDFNTTVSILFVGYMLMQVPSNMMITRVRRPSWYMSCWMLAWAAVSGCTALVQSYGGLVATRFILGIVEAPFYPAATFTISSFYTRREVAARIAILYGAQILATGFSGLIAAGIFAGLDGALGIQGWRWLFIIEGSVTAFVALFGFFTLADEPLTTRWLTESERRLAHDRMERDKLADSDAEASTTWHGLFEACKDVRTWIFTLMKMLQLSACSFNSFLPTVVKTFGFSTTVTLALTCPPYIFAGIVGFLFGWSSGRHHERTYHITAGLGIATIGFIWAAATLNVPARYVACFVFPVGAYSVNSVIIGWASSTLAQSREKRAVIFALINSLGNLGSIYGAYLWPSTDSPLYSIGFGASAGFAFGAVALAWLMRHLLKRANKSILAMTHVENINLYGY